MCFLTTLIRICIVHILSSSSFPVPPVCFPVTVPSKSNDHGSASGYSPEETEAAHEQPLAAVDDTGPSIKAKTHGPISEDNSDPDSDPESTHYTTLSIRY